MVDTTFIIFLKSLSFGGLISLLCILLTMKYNTHLLLKTRLEKIVGKKSHDDNWSSKSKAASLRSQISRIEKHLNEALKSSSSKFKTLRLILYRSGVQRRPEIFLIIFVVIYLVLSFFSIVGFGIPLLRSILMCIIMTSSILFLFLKMRATKWEAQFLVQFPQALDTITRSLKAGLTLGRGIAIVAEELPSPINFEFKYLAAQLQIGSSTEKALVDAADRIGLEDFRFFTLALLIQREMGGSLSEILRKLADVIRSREKFRKKVNTFSAESRVTGIIISSLPFLALIGIEFISPGNIQFFLSDSHGQILGLIIVGLTSCGFIVMRKMTKLAN